MIEEYEFATAAVDIKTTHPSRVLTRLLRGVIIPRYGWVNSILLILSFCAHSRIYSIFPLIMIFSVP